MGSGESQRAVQYPRIHFHEPPLTQELSETLRDSVSSKGEDGNIKSVIMVRTVSSGKRVRVNYSFISCSSLLPSVRSNKDRRTEGEVTTNLRRLLESGAGRVG